MAAGMGTFYQLRLGSSRFPIPLALTISWVKTGWWLTYPSEKYDFVSWDDELPN
jgi:hypothetical protein